MNEEELKKLQSTVEFDFKKAVTIYGPNIIQEEKLTSCYDRVYDFLGELDINDFHNDVSCPDIFNENVIAPAIVNYIFKQYISKFNDSDIDFDMFKFMSEHPLSKSEIYKIFKKIYSLFYMRFAVVGVNKSVDDRLVNLENTCNHIYSYFNYTNEVEKSCDDEIIDENTYFELMPGQGCGFANTYITEDDEIEHVNFVLYIKEYFDHSILSELIDYIRKIYAVYIEMKTIDIDYLNVYTCLFFDYNVNIVKLSILLSDNNIEKIDEQFSNFNNLSNAYVMIPFLPSITFEGNFSSLKDEYKDFIKKNMLYSGYGLNVLCESIELDLNFPRHQMNKGIQRFRTNLLGDEDEESTH